MGKRWWETFPWYTVGSLLLALVGVLAGLTSMVPAEYAMAYSSFVAFVGGVGRVLVKQAQASDAGALNAMVLGEDEFPPGLLDDDLVHGA